MRPQVKICGISERAALQAALRFGADMLGFLHYPASPRHIAPDAAAELCALASGRARVVAVGVDMEDELLQELQNRLRPDFFQLHGKETPERVAEVRERFGIKVIKAIRVRDMKDIEDAHAYEGIADLLLFDAYGESLPGGNGIAFDWTLLPRRGRGEWILSGGLNEENIAEAIEQTAAPIVDVSSGVESAPGRKDPKKIEHFLLAAKAQASAELHP